MYGAAWGYLTDYSGMQQLGARFYWPEIGRFIQQDPIGDGMNWYAYAGSSPVTGADPSGLEDYYVGVDLDAVYYVGGTLNAGSVSDLDQPLQSGIFVTPGAAVGRNVGVAGMAGCTERELEGTSEDIDVNAGPASITYSRDEEGYNGWSGAWGVGSGASISASQTWTYTIQDALVDALVHVGIPMITWAGKHGHPLIHVRPGNGPESGRRGPFSRGGGGGGDGGGGSADGGSTSGSSGAQGEGGPGSSVSPGYWNPGQGHGPKGGGNPCPS